MSLLTLTPTPASALPAPDSPDYAHYRDTLVHQALALVASLPTSPPWTPRKTYHAHHGLATRTYSTSTTGPPPGSGDCEGYRWHARVSRHDPTRTSFDQFERGLLLNHSDNERDYIESCYTAQRLAVVTEGELEVWTTKYTSPFPASRRAFVFTLLTLALPSRPHRTDPSAAPRRAFLVVSLPATHDAAREEDESEGAVRARYVSVEHVEEDDEGMVVWTMAVASDAGGAIPRWITERAMPAKVAEDVPSFVEWVAGGKGGEGRAGA